MKTLIDIPVEVTFTYINSKNKERKIIVFGATFCCWHCKFQQRLLLKHNSDKLEIEEYHANECKYYE